MRMIRKLSQEWLKNFENWLNCKYDIIKEAFIQYYGEEYRDEINSRINEIQYFFALSEVAYISTEKVPEEYLAKKLIRYFKHSKLVLDIIDRQHASSNQIISKAVRQNMLLNYSRSSLEYHLVKILTIDSALGTIHFDSDGNNPIIILPIYFLNDQIIFHEISHVFTTPKDKENIYPNEEVDELLNDLTARDVYKIFKNLGGDKILPYELKIIKEYDQKLYLIQDFYKRFKALIKKCTQVGDIKILEDALGKETLDLYFKLVKKLYHQEKVKSIDINRLKFLIWQMDMYYKTRKEGYQRVRKVF